MSRRPVSLRRIGLSVVFLTYVALLLVGSLRFVRWWRFERPTQAAPSEERVWSYYYPELLRSGALAGRSSLEEKRVLLLGGSVLKHLAEPLSLELQRWDASVRVVDLAVESHTSRDSLLKVRRLDLQTFDAGLVLHAINEVRFNYWPAEEFAADYSHIPWYRKIERDTREGFSARNLAFDMVRDFYVLGPPTEDRWPWGEELKTEATFRHNLEGIASRFQEAGRPLVIATMALHLPQSYTEERFLAGELDYGDGPTRLPAEFWGKKEHVVRGVEAHNEISRQVAERLPLAALLDLARLLPDRGELFEDPCHLAAPGLERASRLLAEELEQALGGSASESAVP